MIKGQPFINLEQHVNLDGYDALHTEISRGIATAKHLGINGLQMYHPGTVRPHAQGIEIKPLSEVYRFWKELPEDDPIKIGGKDLPYNQLTDYLKYAVGAYDFYLVFRVLDKEYKHRGVGELGEYFPNLVKYIEGLVDAGIFKSLHSATLMALDAGGIPWEHYDPENPVTELFDPNDQNFSEITEFIHIKTDCDRPFYVIDSKTNKKVYVNTRVAWWDERDWHGGDPINRPTYTIKINGKFTEEFKKLIGVEGYENEL